MTATIANRKRRAVYVVKGSEDGNIGVFGSVTKAVAVALEYVGGKAEGYAADEVSKTTPSGRTIGTCRPFTEAEFRAAVRAKGHTILEGAELFSGHHITAQISRFFVE